MDDFTILQEIEAYLDGEMSREQKTAFEEKIQMQPELNDMVNTMKISREAIILSGYKKAILETQGEYISSRKLDLAEKDVLHKRSRILPLFLKGLAAGFILIMLATSFLIYDTKENFIERKYLTYLIPIERSAGQTYETLTELYIEERWQEILNHSPSSPQDPQYLFFSAMANFNLANYDSAKQQFEEILELRQQGQTTTFVDEAEFYSVFTFIKTKDYSEAGSMIEEINKFPDHNYYGYFSKWDQFKLQLLEIF